MISVGASPIDSDFAERGSHIDRLVFHAPHLGNAGSADLAIEDVKLCEKGQHA